MVGYELQHVGDGVYDLADRFGDSVRGIGDERRELLGGKVSCLREQVVEQVADRLAGLLASVTNGCSDRDGNEGPIAR